MLPTFTRSPRLCFLLLIAAFSLATLGCRKRTKTFYYLLIAAARHPAAEGRSRPATFYYLLIAALVTRRLHSALRGAFYYLLIAALGWGAWARSSTRSSAFYYLLIAARNIRKEVSLSLPRSLSTIS